MKTYMTISLVSMWLINAHSVNLIHVDMSTKTNPTQIKNENKVEKTDQGKFLLGILSKH